MTLFPQIDNVNTTGEQKTTNSRVQGTVVSFYNLDAVFRALLCIFFDEFLGRKRTCMLGARTTTCIDSIVQASSFLIYVLTCGVLICDMLAQRRFLAYCRSLSCIRHCHFSPFCAFHRSWYVLDIGLFWIHGSLDPSENAGWIAGNDVKWWYVLHTV